MPVWPICFCSIWPIGAPAPMRLPAARMPTSFTDTWASARAAIAASAARSTVSRSGCLPNLVMWIPRIQMSSVAMSVALPVAALAAATRAAVDRLEAEPDRLRARRVGAHRHRGEADLHAEAHVLGVGR